MVISRDLEEVIEIMQKMTVYGEDKDSSSQEKNENKQKRQSRGKGGKGNKDNWVPSGGQKGKIQIVSGDSHQEVAIGIVMVVTGDTSTIGGKYAKSNKHG